MRRKHFILILCMVVTLLFSGCMNQYRRLTPTPTEDERGDMPHRIGYQDQQGQQGQQGQQEQMDFTPYISATYEKADISYMVASSNTSARSGPSTNYPVVYTIPIGTQVRILAKYDGWYVAYHNNRLGFIPMTTTRLSAPAANTPAPDVQGSTGNTIANEETQMLSLINAERAKTGAKPLTANVDLTKVARLKSQDIAAKNYFSHTSPTYGSPFEMLKKYGINYLYAGENLAKNSTVQAAHTALMNSEGHRKNILNPTFTEVGIGVITDEGNTKVYTQMFIGR